MKFSATIVTSALIALQTAIAAPVNVTEEETGTFGTSDGVEFPFSDDAIIGAVPIGNGIAPILLDDSIFLINTTIVDQEFADKLQKRDPSAEAAAWHWINFIKGQPLYKREAGAEAEAEAQADPAAWHWINFIKGQPLYKREAGAEADPAAWHWIQFLKGQPLYKREADADPEAWHWIQFIKGQPLYKREAEADPEAWHWINFIKGQPLY